MVQWTSGFGDLAAWAPRAAQTGQGVQVVGFHHGRLQMGVGFFDTHIASLGLKVQGKEPSSDEGPYDSHEL